MKQSRLLNSGIVLFLLLLVVVMPVRAEYRSSMSRTPRHYISLSMGAAEASNMGGEASVRHLIGAGTNLHIGYEMQVSGFSVGIGVEGQYQYLRDTITNFSQSFRRVDRAGTSVQYEYLYSQFHEQDHVLMVALPIYVGYTIKNMVYFTLGAQLALPVWTNLHSTADMYTQGKYDFGIGPANSIQNEDFVSYGYYPVAGYSYQSTYKEAMRLNAMLEVGAYLPLDKSIKNLRVRLGVYGIYGMRLGDYPSLDLVDYSAVDINPQTQTQANLRENLAFRPIGSSSINKGWMPNLEVGIRATFLIDVTVNHEPCHCLY